MGGREWNGMSENGDFQPDEELTEGGSGEKKSIHYFDGQNGFKDYVIFHHASKLCEDLEAIDYHSPELAIRDSQPLVDELNEALEKTGLMGEQAIVVGENVSTPMTSEQPAGTVNVINAPYVDSPIAEMNSIEGDFCGFCISVRDLGDDDQEDVDGPFAAVLCVRVGSVPLEAPNILPGSAFCSVVDFQPGGIQFVKDIQAEKIAKSQKVFAQKTKKINKKIARIQAMIENDLFDESTGVQDEYNASIIQEIGVNTSAVLSSEQCQDSQFKDALSEWLEAHIKASGSFAQMTTSYALRIDSQSSKHGAPLYHILKKPDKHEYETIEGEVLGIYFLEHYSDSRVSRGEEYESWNGPLTPYFALSNPDWNGGVLYIALENIEEFRFLDKNF